MPTFAQGLTPDLALAQGIAMRRWYRGFVLCLLVMGFASGFVALLNEAGWELSAIFSVPASLLGGFAGIAAVRLARGQGRAVHPVRLWLVALAPVLAPLAAAFLLAFAHALRPSVRNCTPAASAGFFALMPLASAAFSAAAGVVSGRALRSHRLAGALFVALLAGSLLRTGFGMLDGPAIFAANHFFGWFPGPLYDETLPLDSALWFLRLLSLLIALTALLASALFPDQGPAAGRAADDPPPLLFPDAWTRDASALAFLLLALATAAGFRRDFRIDVRRADIQAGLGGHVRTEHFDIWYDAGTKPETVRLLAQDHEYRWHTVTEYLGVTPKRRITSYVFPDAASKKRWTGAGDTQVANPFRGEIYLNGDAFPHPVLEHELAHAISAELGIRPFGIPKDVGLLEGIAVAAAWRDTGRGDPHEQSAAMLREDLLPHADRFLGLGFWLDRQARAYTAAGSFVRFLGERYGMERVRAAYPWGSMERAFGKSVAELDREWREFLQGIEVPVARKRAARERFTQPSLFERPCARELARLEEAGWAALRRNRFDEAMDSFRAWRAVDERVEPIRALFHASRRRGAAEEAASYAAMLVQREIEGSPMWWRAKVHLADLAWEARRLEEAEAGFDEVLASSPPGDLAREAWIKREAVRRGRAGDEAFSQAVLAVFSPAGITEGGRIALALATERTAGSARLAGAYLLGRRLLQAGDLDESVRWLDLAASAMADPDNPALFAELLALRAEALTRLGRLDDARAAWDAVLAIPGLAGDARSRAEDGRARIAWLTQVEGASREFRNSP